MLTSVSAALAPATPGLLESLQKSFETLEAISKSLEEYLETKRIAFPRYAQRLTLAAQESPLVYKVI